MQTRQELIFEFVKAMASTETTTKVATDCLYSAQKDYVRDVYLLASLFADKYLEMC